MKIERQTHNQEIEYVTLAGELDFNSSPQVRGELTKLTEKNSRKILVDLKKVTYIDSSGLAIFIEFFQKIKRSGGKLVLFNLSQEVRSVFEIAKLETVFHLVENHEQALGLVSA